jgi:hypothetical protein
MNACRLLFVVNLISFSAVQVDGEKKRSWLGPNTFYEGSLPSARVGHGFACPNGGTIFAFGGLGVGAYKCTDNDLTESYAIRY